MSGSYVRNMLKGNGGYKRYSYNRLQITMRPKLGEARAADGFLDDMVLWGIITEEEKQNCLQKICREFSGAEAVAKFDAWTLEQVYGHACRIRVKVLGETAIEQALTEAAKRAKPFAADFIDQSGKKRELLERYDAVVFALCRPELLEQMRQDVRAAKDLGKQIIFSVSAEKGCELPTEELLRAWLEAGETLPWNAPIPKDACLFVYGEEGLLCCRELTADAFVTAVPKGYFAKAVVCGMEQCGGCAVYIPKGYDILPAVPIVKKSRLTYRHLAQLCDLYGDGVYGLSVRQLYAAYPQHLGNIYDGDIAPMDISVPSAKDLAEYDALRDTAVKDHFAKTANIRCETAYFDEQLQRQPVCYAEDVAQKGILVHAAKVKNAKKATLLSCPKGVSPRELFQKGDCGIASNFLYFMTKVLSDLHNDLRQDRPLEQADVGTGHLDYRLSRENGARKETFPLFRKACIAKTENGEFLFFSFRLGGGEISLDGCSFRWEKPDVDPKKPADVAVYTPYITKDLTEADRNSFRLPVGQGRVNLVIVQDKVICLRREDVLLPGAGVVVSLSEQAAQPLLAGRKPLGDGYFDVSGMDMQVQLDAPDAVDQAVWQTVQWAYGGGLILIRDGEALTDAEDTDAWFREDGWRSPLSRQTQESDLCSMVKHPRTALGCTEKGELVILVFSGRTVRSSGADYLEMCAVARQMYPDIRWLMNVDGGGSAVLAAVCGGRFMELSYPATSPGSTAGMVRPVHTVLFLPAE